MIRHIVWWTLKSEALGRNAAENARVIQQESVCLRNIAAARSVDVSTRIQAGTTVACDVALVSTHDSLESLDEYKKDPVHVKFSRLITEVSDSRNCIDYEIE